MTISAPRLFQAVPSIRPRLSFPPLPRSRRPCFVHSRRAKSTKHPRNFIPPTRQELSELRERVQDFTRREIPESLAWETDRQNEFPKDMWKKFGDAGLLGITADEEYGGLAMGYQAHCIVMEELSRASGSIALSYAAHSQLCINQLSLKGTVAQKSRFLPPLISGAHVGALAMSEASAGSDVVSMRTTATATPSAYEVNGTKMWITNGPDAHTLVLYTKTDPSAIPPSRGITAFVVPTREVQGFACTRKLDKLGMRGSNTGELSFSGMALPAESVLGEVNGGVRVLMEGLDLERLVLSAGPIGLMQRALEEALPYAHERVQFGQPIAKQSLLQGKLADMYTATQASRALTMETARRIDEAAGEVAAEGLVSSRDCTATILFAAEQATRVCLDAVQVFGGMGYLEEEGCAPVARLVRDAKLYEIGAGTSEIRRIVVGRSFGREFGVR